MSEAKKTTYEDPDALQLLLHRHEKNGSLKLLLSSGHRFHVCLELTPFDKCGKLFVKVDHYDASYYFPPAKSVEEKAKSIMTENIKMNQKLNADKWEEIL